MVQGERIEHSHDRVKISVALPTWLSLNMAIGTRLELVNPNG